MLGAVITWGLYSAFLKKRKFEVSLLTFVHILCTFGLISLIPQFLYEFSQGQTVTINTNFVYLLLYLAIFPSIGSYYCWAGAVTIIGANRSGIFLSLIPLFSTIMAIAFFNEEFQFYHFIGSILTLFGLFLSNKKTN
jgi:drug/metabolite transporter (DMT)-like permease